MLALLSPAVSQRLTKLPNLCKTEGRAKGIRKLCACQASQQVLIRLARTDMTLGTGHLEMDCQCSENEAQQTGNDSDLKTF
jgi:hypothetical protein